MSNLEWRTVPNPRTPLMEIDGDERIRVMGELLPSLGRVQIDAIKKLGAYIIDLQKSKEVPYED